MTGGPGGNGVSGTAFVFWNAAMSHCPAVLRRTWVWMPWRGSGRPGGVRAPVMRPADVRHRELRGQEPDLDLGDRERAVREDPGEGGGELGLDLGAPLPPPAERR